MYIWRPMGPMNFAMYDATNDWANAPKICSKISSIVSTQQIYLIAESQEWEADLGGQIKIGTNTCNKKLVYFFFKDKYK